ncbi:MAG: hypothetical protein MRY21_02350 [Simkaniaceae bacterium]|nr:hypothetical protein [Simkaniaceae bacterium]
MTDQKVKLTLGKRVYALLILLLAMFGAITFMMLHNVKSIKKKMRNFSVKLENPAEFTEIVNKVTGTTPLPPHLEYLPYADYEGLILAVKRIKINGAQSPYNSSLLEKRDGSGYYLFFRYDTKSNVKLAKPHVSYETYIGVAELDEHFQHKHHSFHIIDTGSCHSEDPRGFYHNGELFISYNDIVQVKTYSRSIRIAALDETTWKTKYITDLNIQQAPIEKNWMPFTCNNTLHFIYNVSPHKIFTVANTKKNDVQPAPLPEIPTFLKNEWEARWGQIRGGTPAILVDGEYMAFFHSWFHHQGKNWYSMGAYTFEKEPPFRITGISYKPILFQTIYDSPHIHTSNSAVKHIYPSGMVIKDNLIHVSCGENDCATKIITFNKEKLMHSLRKIDVDDQDRHASFMAATK